MCHFDPSTVAAEGLSNGMRSALCKECVLESQGKTPDEINDELKELAFEQ